MSRFLGIDLGTSYFKAGIYDDAGNLCGLGREAVPKVCDSGRCELPVDAFWKALSSAITSALAEAGIPAEPDDERIYTKSSARYFGFYF